MSEWDLAHVPRVQPRIFETNPAAPPPPAVPGLLQKMSLRPSGTARAIFQEGPWPSRPIPFGVDEVLIKPGRGVGTSNSFELPQIGENVVNGKTIWVINETRNAHHVIWGDQLNGNVLKIELDGLASNVRARVIGGRWMVVGLFNATQK